MNEWQEHHSTCYAVLLSVCVCASASMTTEFSNEKDDGVVVVVDVQVRRIKKITDYYHFQCFFVWKGLSPLEQ